MMDRRLFALTSGLGIWGLGILGKVASLQVLQHGRYSALARARQEMPLEVPAPRGTILDRNGSCMAMSDILSSVFVNPLRIPDMQVAAGLLAPILGFDRDSLKVHLEAAAKKRQGFVWVKRKVTHEQANRLRSLGMDYIFFQSEPQRYYPHGGVAAHVLGSVDFQENGNAGLEKACEKDLRGTPGLIRVLTDVKRRGIESRVEREVRPGTPLTLTIHERLQFVAERELAKAAKGVAERASLVVMNPYTGDVLAMASWPAYDPNAKPRKGEPRVIRQNQAVEAPFEPGSVFKVITLSAALETTSLNPESLIDCHNGVLKLPGRVVHDVHAYGTMPMKMVLAKSSNIGAIMVGTRVGEQRLKEYIARFGFGQRTGIELPAESPGKVRKVWQPTSLSSAAMGHELSTTTLQLAQACSVIANGGLLVRPRLILKQGDRTLAPTAPRRVIRAQTAITMRQMMEGVVLFGTGAKARLKGYTSGGKTGSAQIYSVEQKRFTHSYNASFMGFAPVTNPAIVVVVTLNGTHGNGGFGGAVSAPVFNAVATEALRLLDVPKDLPDDAPAPAHSDTNDLAIAHLDDGVPSVLDEGAEAGEEALVQGPVLPPPMRPAGPTVPDFSGKTMRAVLAEAAAHGLTVSAAGSGVARSQYPPPGAGLRQGERIRVQFAR